MIKDRNLDRKRVVKRIPFSAFSVEPSHTHGLTLTIADNDNAATDGVAVYFDEDGAAGGRLMFVSPTDTAGTDAFTTDSAEGIVGADDGAPESAEVSTFGITGGAVAAAGDSFSVLDLNTLMEVDLSETIGIRVLWVENVSGPAATDDVTWVVTYKQFDPGEALAAASTALDTVVANHEPGETTGYIFRRTARGIINANTFDETARIGGLVWNVEADVLNGYSADEVTLLGIEIDYMPLKLRQASQAIEVHTSQSAA